MPGKEKRIERYCIMCNNELEMVIVDAIERPVCMSCGLITSGYMEEEKEIVGKLKNLFMKKDWYQIEGVLNVFRSERKNGRKRKENENNRIG